MKERKLELKLENVYGGDGFERPHEVEEIKLKRSKSTITIRQDVGVPIERMKEEEKIEKKQVVVHTFRRDQDGIPMLRLGGAHGKLWGAMQEAGFLLYEIGQVPSKASIRRTMQSVQISPQWVRLEGFDVENGIEMDILPQILAGPGNAMISQYFDMIPECECEVTLRYPEELEKVILKLLDRVQTMNTLNKRRGTITIITKAKR